MKIKILNELIIIDVLIIILVLTTIFFPSSIARIILGIPFLLFFPGYVLVVVLFPTKEGIDSITRVILALGLSIAIVALIGLLLNITAWGIRLEPVVYTTAAFILIMSALAMFRRVKLLKQKLLIVEYTLKIPRLGGTSFDKFLSIILIISVAFASGLLIYNLARPKVGERFTEYYILGLYGKLQDYPTDFVIEEGQVTHIIYGPDAEEVPGDRGIIRLGIVNHESENTTYLVLIKIDGEYVDMYVNGETVEQLGPIELSHGEKWEHEIGIAPRHAIENPQRVEFLLYKNGDSEPYDILFLWINVEG